MTVLLIVGGIAVTLAGMALVTVTDMVSSDVATGPRWGALAGRLLIAAGIASVLTGIVLSV